MILTRKNIKGGRRIVGFPIREEDGMIGMFLGYCPCGCNEQILMALRDRDVLMAAFHCEDETVVKVKKLLRPKTTITDSFVKRVGEWANKKLQPELVDNI